MAKQLMKSPDISLITKFYSDWLAEKENAEITIDKTSDHNITATVWESGDLTEIAGIRENADDGFVFFCTTFEFEL